MKKSLLLMGALFVSAAFVSCVDDEESPVVTDMRKVQLEKDKVQLAKDQATLESMYVTEYANAVAKIKSLENDLSILQEALNNYKDGLTTAAKTRDILVSYYETLIQIANSERDVHTVSGYTYSNLDDFSNDTYSYNRYKNRCQKEWDEYINDLNESIEKAKNDYNDESILIKMYENQIAQVKDEIEFQQKIANKMRDNLGFNGNSNQNNTPATSEE